MARLTKSVLVRHPETNEPVSLVEGQEAPKWYTTKANLDGAAPETDADEEEEPAGDSAYADLKVSELKDEIENRNLLRPEDDQLSTDGKKDELVAALEQDDAEQDN